MTLAMPAPSALPAAVWRIGIAVTLVLLLLAFVSVVWTPYPVGPVEVGAALQPPGGTHLFGTDQLGRDLLSLVMRGMLTSFVVAAVAVAVGAVIGVPLGLAAASWGGIADWLLSALGGYVAAVPAFAIAAILAARFGPSAGTAMVALGLSMVPAFMASTRVALYAGRRPGYAVAAQLAGALPFEIVRRYSLPAFTRAIGAEMVAQLAVGVLGEAALSFVGLGTAAPATSLGLLLHDAPLAGAGQPMLIAGPGLVLVLMVLALNITSRGLKARNFLADPGASDAAA
jgi:peptide/nickel transport system permease protein